MKNGDEANQNGPLSILVAAAGIALAFSVFVIYKESAQRREIEECIRENSSKHRRKSRDKRKSGNNRRNADRNQRRDFDESDDSEYGDSAEDDTTFDNSQRYSGPRTRLARSVQQVNAPSGRPSENDNPLSRSQPQSANHFDLGSEPRFESMDQIKARIEEDIELLNDIEPQLPRNEDEGPLLNFRDFLRIFKVIRKYTHPSRFQELHVLRSKRRRALQKKQTEEYRQYAQQLQEAEERIHEEITDTIFTHFNFSQEVFQESYNLIEEDDNAEQLQKVQEESTLKFLKEQEKRGIPSNIPDRQRTFQIFNFEIDMKRQILTDLMRIESDQELKQQHEFMQQELEDRIFLKFNVEKDDYNHAINLHRLRESQQVQEKLEQIEEMVDEPFKERMRNIYQEDDGERSRELTLDYDNEYDCISEEEIA